MNQLIKLLPFIVRLFPQIVKGPFVRGKLIPLNITPATDEDLARELNRKVDLKRNDTGTADSSLVIKVSDAIDCVKANFDDTTLIKEFLIVAVQSLVEGRQSKASGQRMFDEMVQCLRENALRQNTVRIGTKTVKNPRPAKGHGTGRGNF